MLMAAVLLPAALDAQGPRPAPGMVLDEGTWRAPTRAAALRALVNGEGTDRASPAVAVLRQTFEPRSDADLRAFVDELTRIMIEGDEEEARGASLVLSLAEDDEDPDIHGTPYPGVVNAFIRVYEAREDKTSDEAWNALAEISWSKGGAEYVLEVFNAAEVPPRCRPHAPPAPGEVDPCQPRSEWCSAGLHLLDTRHAPNEEEYESRCIKKW